jgi:predicted lipoprotein with Yx(FWY)xxD motif
MFKGSKTIAIAGAVLFAAPVPAAPIDAPLAAPVGITFQAAGAGKVYADTSGKTLYTSDADQSGVSTCVDACAKSWIPATAPREAKALGEWSVAARTDGARQWVLKGKPLYTSAKDENPGDVKGTTEGWHAAAFQPPSPAGLPPDILIVEAIALPGPVLVNADRRTLYIGPLDCAGKCAEIWTPVVAPAIAGASGDFTAVKRKDGLRQWAYKGAALYTYSGDLREGELAGRDADPRFRVAALASYFMPAGVSIRANREDALHPEILTAANGHTLYAREFYAYTQTFHAKNGDRGAPSKGRMIGPNGCIGECLAHWQPFLAPTNAVAAGNWTIVVRDDGARQWAYQGYALYTFDGDDKPGDTHGNERFDLWEKTLTGRPPGTPYTTASTMYWRTAAP